MTDCKDIERVISTDKSWYKKIWSLDIKNMSWVEETGRQVDFIWEALGLTGRERVLDLACGFGRHALELARRGCEVVGVDITCDYVDDANESAKRENLNARFFAGDIRDCAYREEFDVVLNLADGAIGYLENDGENEKIFRVAVAALKSKGKHLIDICNGGYARKHFPKRHWVAGSNSISLADFDWDEGRSLMYYGGLELEYGKELSRPLAVQCNPTRLYRIDELRGIYRTLGMDVVAYYGDFKASVQGSDDVFQIQVIAQKD
jgi:SAM-dependent methyltransferase